MHQKTRKREQLKSQEKEEQTQAVEHLEELEKKIKVKKDIQNIHVLETA